MASSEVDVTVATSTSTHGPADPVTGLEVSEPAERDQLGIMDGDNEEDGWEQVQQQDHADGNVVANASGTCHHSSQGAKPKEKDKGEKDKVKSSQDDKEEEEDEGQKSFECNICLDVAKDAVISVCGHLFCWPCLHQWLETRPNRQICPVCKAGISREKVIPLYGRGSTDQKDPRDKIPPRPRGQRPEPENTGGAGFFNPFSLGGNHAGGFQMSFGIGAFPFGFFATNFNLGDGGGARGMHPRGAHPNNPAQAAQLEEEQFLHRVFLWVALAFIFWLMVMA